MGQQKPEVTAFLDARILWNGALEDGRALLVANGHIVDLVAMDAVPSGAKALSLSGGILAPGFVDLQVNGGGGVLFNNAPTVDTLATMSQAHARLGTTSFLPTLITDSPDRTIQAIQAVDTAIKARMPGVLGLHLEGPHIAVARKGAHLASHIRVMNDQDLTVLLEAARLLPVLKVTLAPENTPISYIGALVEAGVVVSLGHTDADYDTCLAYQNAGASCVTHLFNAQSQMTSRSPGTVGAALSLGQLSAGLIADGIHVDPRMITLALRAKQGPGEIFLVTDAMATAGSEISSFRLNEREILRASDRLTLEDGTLAGAHVTMAKAIQVLINDCEDSPDMALNRATLFPADVIKAQGVGRLAKGATADLVHLADDFSLTSVWQNGRPVSRD